MSILGGSRHLGLAIRERSIVAAEVRVARDQFDVVHRAEFVFPPELSWESPAPLGAAFRKFLRQNRFSASRAVAGVPARWIIARQKDLPPVNDAMASSALRLQAERDFSQYNDLVFDYAGSADPKKPRKVLLVAMLRQRLDRVVTVADEAGLSLAAVTASTLPLLNAQQSAARRLSLVLWPEAAEFAACGENVPTALRHMPVGALGAAGNGHGAAAFNTLAGEVQRTVMLMGAGNAPRELMLWDGVGLDASAASVLSERTGLPVRLGGNPLSADGTATDPAAGRFAAAAALAMAATRREMLAVDLLHSRLAPPKTRRIGRRTLWGAVAAVALIAAITWLIIDVRRSSADLDSLRTRQAEMKPSVKAAENLASRVKQASGYFDLRPPHLGALREITSAFPPDGQVWATSLTLRDNGKVALAGKAVDQRSILAVMDRLKSNRSFTDVKLLDMREANARSKEVSFSLNFTYTGTE